MSTPVPDTDSEPLFESEDERLEFAAACEAWRRRRKDEAPNTDPAPGPIDEETLEP